MEQCCETCKYHVRPDILLWMHLPGEGNWVCNNSDSKYSQLETENTNTCNNYEKRQRV